jgi:subtilase family protein
VRSRNGPRDAHRDVPETGVRGTAARLALALAAALAVTSPAAAHARRTAVIVRVRPSPMALAPLLPGQVAAALQRRAQHDQAALLRFLHGAAQRGQAGDVRALWIDDAVALEATPALLARLRRRADVGAITPDRTLRIEPTALAAAAEADPTASIAATGAPQLWAQGQTGRGAVVAVLDTGLAPGFPQLSTASGAWFDPYGQHPTPFEEDARGHGTDVAGIVVAMAPDVRILAARVFSDGGRSTTSAVHRAFEWALDPDGDPRTNDAPDVLNGSWDDGGPGRCETEFDSDLAALRAAGIVPVFAAGNAGPAPGTGASPASAPGAVAVGSVSSTDVVSGFSGRGPSPCSNAVFPTLAAYGENIAVASPGGETVISGTSFAAPQVAGAAALLTAMFPGVTPDALIDALVAGARDVGPPGADQDTGAGVVDVVHSAALLAGADHAGPSIDVRARWSRDAAHPGIALSGRAEERGGGTSAGLTADAFISLRATPTTPIALTAEPSGTTSAALTGALTPREVRRLLDGRHGLYVRARDATGNWGPARAVALPADRAAPAVRASGSRHGNRIAAVLEVHEHGSGLVSLRYRVDIGGRAGRWHSVAPGDRVRVKLFAQSGRKAILRVRAIDLAGNETKAGFVLPR